MEDPYLNQEISAFESRLLWSLDELNTVISTLPSIEANAYYQLILYHPEEEQFVLDSRFGFLGYDLTEVDVITGPSSLLNCGVWKGQRLDPISKRRNQYGLLELQDAVQAQAIFP
ncbi:MAG: hypothetical protein OEQ53_14980 [Saprospiraceae bacterium]|nr:hypothetical protein [Saprospiraceae bacterium]